MSSLVHRLRVAGAAIVIGCAEMGPPPTVSFTAYERETPHTVAGRHSRYVLRSNGTFDLRDWTGADTTTYTGRWTLSPQTSHTLLDFDGFADPYGCGEGFGAFLMNGHMAVSYCGVMLQAGLEEGVYSSAPVPGSPGPAPSQAGQIAFVRDGRIYLANTDGGGLVPLSSGPGDGDPAWSPDGNRIAFTRTSGTTSGIYIMDADGGNVVQRATSGGDPSWSPDGEWLAFTCMNPVMPDICLAKSDDASTPDRITHDGGQVGYAAWSPDGTRIAFTSDWAAYDLVFDIYVVAPDGSHRTTLVTTTHSPYEHYQAAWSPDGQRVAFVSCPWGWNICSSSVLAVIGADGSGARALVAASGFASPTWSPDGQIIAFASSRAIDWVSADGAQRGRIIDNGTSPAWRPERP